MVPAGQRGKGLIPPRGFLETPKKAIEPQNATLTDDGRACVASTLLRRWFTIVEDLMQRELTYESDRLVAIDAIATVVAERLSLTYSLGVWVEALPRCLVWRANENSQLSESLSSNAHNKPIGLQFPSWSWAACNMHLSYIDAELDRFKGEARVLITATAADKATPRTIRVCGMLLKVTETKMRAPAEVDENCLHIYVENRSYRSKKLYGSRTIPRPMFPRTFNGYYILYRDSSLFDYTSSKLWFLPTYAGPIVGPGIPFGLPPRVVLRTIGLVLEKLAGLADTYIRVGLAILADKRDLKNVEALSRLGEEAAAGKMVDGVSFILV